MPLTRKLLGDSPSPVGLGLVKVVSLSFFYAGYVLMAGNRFRLLAPIGIAMLGAFATLNNLNTLRLVRRGA